MMCSFARFFVVLCLLPALVAAQNAPASAGREDQTQTQNQKSDDQAWGYGTPQAPAAQDQRSDDQAWGYGTPPGQPNQPAQDKSYNSAAATQAPAPTAANAPQPVKHSPEGNPILEDGTPVRLRLARTLSSVDCRVGDRVDFQVVDPIVLDGVTVIPQGSMAWGKVIEAEHKKRLARGGKLAVMIQSVRLANAERAPLRAVREAEGKGHTALMSGAMVGTAIVFLPAAPLFLLMHGRDVKIAEGTEITAYVNGDTTYTSNPSVYSATTAPGVAPASAAAPAPTPLTATAPAPPVVAPAPPPSAPSTSPELTPDEIPPEQPADTARVEAIPAEGAPLSTELNFTSTPEGATIELDGNYVGRTPSTIGVPGGEHTVRISKNGYQTYQKQLETAGGTQSIHADLQSAQ